MASKCVRNCVHVFCAASLSVVAIQPAYALDREPILAHDGRHDRGSGGGGLFGFVGNAVRAVGGAVRDAGQAIGLPPSAVEILVPLVAPAVTYDTARDRNVAPLEAALAAVAAPVVDLTRDVNGLIEHEPVVGEVLAVTPATISTGEEDAVSVGPLTVSDSASSSSDSAVDAATGSTTVTQSEDGAGAFTATLPTSERLRVDVHADQLLAEGLRHLFTDEDASLSSDEAAPRSPAAVLGPSSDNYADTVISSARVQAAADVATAELGVRPTVSSRRRTILQQANAMYELARKDRAELLHYRASSAAFLSAWDAHQSEGREAVVTSFVGVIEDALRRNYSVSDHLSGTAIDFDVDDSILRERGEAAAQALRALPGVRAVLIHAGHIHVSFTP